MNDFFLASGRSISIDENNIHQFKMHNFDEWASLAKPLKDLKKNKDYSNEILNKYVEKNIAEVVGLIALAFKVSVDEFIQVKDANNLNLTEIVELIITVNSAYFDEKEQKQRDDIDPRKKSSWFDSFQLLISNGHSHTEIMQMTYGAFIEYIRAAQNAEKRKLSSLAGVFRAAQHANMKSFKKLIDDLKK
jgi:hypothetical protein